MGKLPVIRPIPPQPQSQQPPLPVLGATTAPDPYLVRRVASISPAGLASSPPITVPSGGSLQIRWSGRTNSANQSDVLFAQFNQDTGANYDYWIQTLAAAYSQATAFAQTSLRVGVLAGGALAAGLFDSGVIDIPALGVGMRRQVIASQLRNDSVGGMELSQGDWRNTTSPLTSVTLIANATTFATGTIFQFIWYPP